MGVFEGGSRSRGVQVLDAERRGGDFCFGKSLVSDHAPLALVHATSGVDDGRP